MEMKRIPRLVAAIAMAMGTLYAGSALAEGSCEQNLKDVKAIWKQHLDRGAHSSVDDGSAQQITMENVIKHAEKACADGRSEEANDNLALLRRHMGTREFKEGR